MPSSRSHPFAEGVGLHTVKTLTRERERDHKFLAKGDLVDVHIKGIRLEGLTLIQNLISLDDKEWVDF